MDGQSIPSTGAQRCGDDHDEEIMVMAMMWDIGDGEGEDDDLDIDNDDDGNEGMLPGLRIVGMCVWQSH